MHTQTAAPTPQIPWRAQPFLTSSIKLKQGKYYWQPIVLAKQANTIGNEASQYYWQ